jgi:serine protease
MTSSSFGPFGSLGALPAVAIALGALFVTGAAAADPVALSGAPRAAAAVTPPAAVPFDPPALATDEAEATVPEELEGEIVVDVRDDATESDISNLARTYGLTLTPNSPWSAAHDKLEDAHVERADRASEPALLDSLAHDPRVEHAEAMSVFRASFVPDDPLYAAKQWHLARVGAESAWEYTCGRGVTVAVVDTGVACWDKGPFSRGTDLTGARCGGGYDFVNDRDEASDDQGHGTHVAGTIAQDTNNGKGAAGLAFCANLMPIKVLTKQGWGTVANVAEGIRYAADNGAQVINLSLGGPIKSAILEDAVEHAIARGVVVVAAAGNSGRSVGWPAAYDGVLAVSASDANDKIAWFSSRGPEVGIAAPGVAVTQQTVCDGGRNHCEIFGTFNGTSMASPHVAGAAALLIAEGVTDPKAVRAALESGATSKDDASLYGAGILNAGKSVAGVFLRHLLLRFGWLATLVLYLWRRIRRRGGEPKMSFGVATGALFGAVGLVPFAPYLGLLARAGRFREWAELLARPFGEWDMALGANVHRWLPLAGALPVIAVASLLLGVKRFRPWIGGFAAGTAALAGQLALSGDAAFALGTFAMRLYAMVSVVVCVWIARIALDTRRA